MADDDAFANLSRAADDARRAIDHIYQGRVRSCAEFTLATTGTSTTVTKTGISTQSVILTQAFSSSAANADITRIVPGKDTFTVTHTATSGGTKTHRYVCFTGVRSSTLEP